MQKLKMCTPDLSQSNIVRIRTLFPNCVTEAHDTKGQITLKVDFDLLRQELSGDLVEGPQERYRLDWPGKRQAMLTANAPIAKSLRPCREESVEFDTTENLYIEGDNLEVLKLLQESYLGQVKMIYIDPPYNTGNDFIYKDDFAENSGEFLRRDGQYGNDGKRMVQNFESNGRFHSDWLSMIYKRLRIARNLLSDDGVIFISIDDNEAAQLRKICDEVLGAENFITQFIWEKRVTRENRKIISVRHDYLLCYTKRYELRDIAIGLMPMTDEARERYMNPDKDPRGVWTSVPAIAQAGHGTANQFYTLTTPSGRKVEPPSGSCWRYTREKMDEAIADNRIWFASDGNGVPRIKKFITEGKQGLTPETMWLSSDAGTNDSAKRELVALFDGVAVFETPKPVNLLLQCLKISTNNQKCICLDYFSGTAPLAHAVMQVNAEDGGKRKFIMVQLPEVCPPDSEAAKAGYANICEIGKERIRRAGKKIKEEKPLTASDLDIGFRVLKVKPSCMTDVYYTPDETKQRELDFFENINPDATPEDLLFQVLTDWGVELHLPIAPKTIQGKTVFFVDENSLAACFDSSLNDDFIKELAAHKPVRAVFRDSGFADDAARINAEQIFKQLSPDTEVRVL